MAKRNIIDLLLLAIVLCNMLNYLVRHAMLLVQDDKLAKF